MSAPTFDNNMWYQVIVQDTGFVGTVLYTAGGTHGATFTSVLNTTSTSQRWQIFTLNSTTWVLRTQESGSNSWLSSGVFSDDTAQNENRPFMARGDVADSSAFWTISPWGDGTYYFTNAANGTGWHINKKAAGTMNMSPNITAPQDGQRFQFETITPINNKAFSTVGLKGAVGASSTSSNSLSTSSTTSTSSSSPTSTSTTAIKSSGGLSTGSQIAIGVTIGFVALLSLIILGLFLWRRRNNRRNPYPNVHEMPNENMPQASLTKYEMYHDSMRHEAPYQNQRPAELVGDTIVPIPGKKIHHEVPATPVS